MRTSDPEKSVWAALYKMLAWLSPGFPIGSFSFSHGLEAAAENGAVRDRETLQDWIGAILRWGDGRIDAEILLETTIQGDAFLKTCCAAWADPFLDRWAACSEAACYPAAVGAAMARAGVPLEWALVGYLQTMAANLVSAGLRLGIIGQTDGQRILAALEPVIGSASAAALTREPDCFGTATFAVELASMAHETQYTRLFRS